MPTQLPLVVYDQELNQRPPRRRVCDLPIEERPLYRLHHHGSNALSTTELLALLLGTADATGLSNDLLKQFGSLHRLARASKAQLMRLRGIGEAQAGRLMAVVELSGRKSPVRPMPPTCLCRALKDLQQEELHVILLDTRNRVLDIRTIYRGSLNTSMIRISEIFRPAIEAPAAAVIMAHNHPSTDVSPSPEDVNVTRQAVQAGKLLNIELLDQCAV